jgi:hypothetical protein
LRDPQARRDYDATLGTTTRPGIRLPATRRPRAYSPRPALPRSRMRGLPPILLRYLPQWVLAGTALIAVMVVGALYLNNPPAPAMPNEEAALRAVAMRQDTATSALAGDMHDRPMEKPLPPAASHAHGETPQMRALAPAPLRGIAVNTAKPAAPAAPSLQSGIRLTQEEEPAPAVPAEVERPPAAPEAVPQPPQDPAMKVAVRVEPQPLPVPPAQSARTESAQPEPDAAQVAAGPVQVDPDATLARFMSSFERGDTQAFMALFDEVAIGRAGGKSNIRHEHELLFRSTDLRHIAINGMTWSRDGDWIRGTGRYQTTLMRKGELVLRTETGVFRIQLMRRGDQALIMGLDLQPEGPS